MGKRDSFLERFFRPELFFSRCFLAFIVYKANGNTIDSFLSILKAKLKLFKSIAHNYYNTPYIQQ